MMSIVNPLIIKLEAGGPVQIQALIDYHMI